MKRFGFLLVVLGLFVGCGVMADSVPLSALGLDTRVETMPGETGGGVRLVSQNKLLALANRLYHYGDINIVPSPDDWFTFSGGVITGFNYTIDRKNVVIPYEIGGEPVVSIGSNAFSDVDSGIGKPVISVVAPKTVTLVGNGAFNNCSALTSISLPMVTSVGYYAFFGCSALTAVSLPSATSIGVSAFAWCTKLATVILPSVTSVGENAFSNYPNLTAITLGKTPPTWQAVTISTATIYVPHDAIGYSDMFYGMPVIRATESADNFYLGGKTLEDRFDFKADKTTLDSEIAGLSDVYLGINAKADSATFSDNAANAEVASFAHDADRANSAYSAENVNGFTVGIDVPYDAVFTDTIVDISGKADAADVAAVEEDVVTLAAEVLDPWIDWSATITPNNGTATVTRATGAEPMLTLTDDVVISVPTDNWPTTGVSRVSLSLWAGSHSVTLLTNTVEYSSTPTISTNDWTTILFRRTGDQERWKGVGL